MLESKYARALEAATKCVCWILFGKMIFERKPRTNYFGTLAHNLSGRIKIDWWLYSLQSMWTPATHSAHMSVKRNIHWARKKYRVHVSRAAFFRQPHCTSTEYVSVYYYYTGDLEQYQMMMQTVSELSNSQAKASERRTVSNTHKSIFKTSMLAYTDALFVATSFYTFVALEWIQSALVFAPAILLTSVQAETIHQTITEKWWNMSCTSQAYNLSAHGALYLFIDGRLICLPKSLGPPGHIVLIGIHLICLCIFSA